MKNSIAIIDLGGQYCHMISRRLGELGVDTEILAPNASMAELRSFAGVVLSGGPNSVYDDHAPTMSEDLLLLGKPILGICYGHQLLAKALGGKVIPGRKEYGPSRLRTVESTGLFAGTPQEQSVWMSHSDSVSMLPKGARCLATTDRCEAAAFVHQGHQMYAVQFHPEVAHTRHGTKLLENFGFDICGVAPSDVDYARIDRLESQVREKVGEGSVFFLVSGGVDSMVAFTLCARALPRDRVLGLYVDTGFMRNGETEELRQNLRDLGLEDRVTVRDESKRFYERLEGVVEPETKRKIIGQLFVEIQAEAMRDFGISDETWFLGQGTIYPDTIESGGAFGRAALIKTHHNRCAEIQALLDRGRVVEPLTDFYKDQVRKIGDRLGLKPELVNRWPFPGPGLAIRCICTENLTETKAKKFVTDVDLGPYKAFELPIETVGVQGDSRTYRRVVALVGPLDYDRVQEVSSAICSSSTTINRVILQIGGNASDVPDSEVMERSLSRPRVGVLQASDAIVRNRLASENLSRSVWQFPVVQVPVSVRGGESIVLRPVESEDGMTAAFGRLPEAILTELANELRRLSGVDNVFLDVTDKPPATIEWE